MNYHIFLLTTLLIALIAINIFIMIVNIRQFRRINKKMSIFGNRPVGVFDVDVYYQYESSSPSPSPSPENDEEAIQ